MTTSQLRQQLGSALRRAIITLAPRHPRVAQALAAPLRRPPRLQPALLVDITMVHRHDRRTGIQRVVRALFAALQADPPPGLPVWPVYADDAGHHRHSRHLLPESARAAAPPEGQHLDIRPGDIFLGLDLTAHLFPPQAETLARWRQRGAAVHYVVYDLIPLRHPEFSHPGMPAVFRAWLRALAPAVNGLHAISQAVADDLRAWYAQAGQAAPPIHAFPLGADLECSHPTTGLPDDAQGCLARWRAQPSYLMVGTIEPRKGHGPVLDAFERRWANGHPDHLILVGQPGWRTEALQQRLRDHPEQGRRLHWLSDASDEYLDRLYATVDALIAASWAEGYGLPLIEAARHATPVIARDIPVFREIAPPGTVFFTDADADADDTGQGRGRPGLDSCLDGPPPPRPACAPPLPTWAEAAQALLQRITAA